MKNAESKLNESMSRLGNFKKMLTRDEMKKVMGGYYTCGTKLCHGSGTCDANKNCVPDPWGAKNPKVVIKK
jgi:hypothetical protein